MAGPVWTLRSKPCVTCDLVRSTVTLVVFFAGIAAMPVGVAVGIGASLSGLDDGIYKAYEGTEAIEAICDGRADRASCIAGESQLSPERTIVAGIARGLGCAAAGIVAGFGLIGLASRLRRSDSNATAPADDVDGTPWYA